MGALDIYINNGNAAVLAVSSGNDLLITSNFREDKSKVLEATKSDKKSN